MLNLDTPTTALVAADNKTPLWVIHVSDKNGVGYGFRTGAMGSEAWAADEAWGAGEAWSLGITVNDVIITDFNGIELRRNSAESGIITPSEMTFSMSNPTDAGTPRYDFNNFKGGTVLVELFLGTPTYGEKKINGWKFNIKNCEPGYQKLKFTCEDFLQKYLKGDYPNTRLPDDVFPSSRTYGNDALCVPVPFGAAYVPLRDVYITSAGYLMLGSPAFTYTISSIRSPRSLGTKCEWTSGSFTFTQSTKADAAAVNWRVFQAIIADVDNNGTADAPGFWRSGDTFLDPPVKFTRSDTATMTNPADVIAFVLKDMGVPAANIDEAGTFAAARAVFDGYTTPPLTPLTFIGAFWHKQDRQKVLAQLLTQCNSCLDVGETIQLRVLSKTSKATITDADVLRSSEQGEGSFSYQPIVNEDLSDSGYIAYQKTGEAQDSFQKVLVAAGAAATVISDEVVECPFVQDSQNAKRIGTLHFQRKLLKEAEAGFLSKGTRLALQTDDVITINDTNYGGSYTVLIDSVGLNKDLSIQFQCSKYTTVFSDWADVSPTSVTVPTAPVTGSWTPVVTGPDSTTPVVPNLLPGRLRVGIGTDYILLDPETPLRVSLYDDNVEIYRVGDLNGFLGYVAEIYGLAIGDSTRYLKYDGTNGLRIAGAISAGTLDIGGDDATSFHVDTGGGIWSGASIANKATAPFRVFNDGQFHFGSDTKYVDWNSSVLSVGGEIIATGNLIAKAAVALVWTDPSASNDVTALETVQSIAITTTGYPLLISYSCAYTSTGVSRFDLYRGDTALVFTDVGGEAIGLDFPVIAGTASQMYSETPAAGTYTYYLKGSGDMNTDDAVMSIVELKKST